MNLEAVVSLALAEDLGEVGVAGDVTAAATVPPHASASAAVVARQSGVLAGSAAIATVFALLDPAVRVTRRAEDGDRFNPGDVLAEVEGPARAVLAGERTALNFVTHLSGVATLTAAYVEAVAGTGCAVRDTRKTLPGLRALQKAAVVAGGGVNHRAGLADGLLVKDNHVAVTGDVAAATAAATAAARTGELQAQIEVDDLDQLRAALDAGATAVLLDNFTLPDLVAAVALAADGVFLEASGGITLATVRAVAETGVDAVAVGALTHSAPAVDLGLDVTVAASCC